MNIEDQIKAAAELDGWKYYPAVEGTEAHWKDNYGGWFECCHLDYPTSYDAIIPLIQKQDMMHKETMCKLLGVKNDYCAWIRATPAYLLEVLLRATGKWTS